MTMITINSRPSTVATEEELQLDLFVDGSQWVGVFDSLEVFRSRVSDQGPYEALTGPKWAPARIPIGAPDPPLPLLTGPSVTISGKVLNLLVNETTPLSITFSGTNPLTFAQVALQVIAQGAQLIYAYVVSNLLVIQTAQPGNVAILRVVGGDAAAILGLPITEPGSVSFGQDARIPLIQGKDLYSFIDYNGDIDFFYRTRFFNSLSQTTSDYSLPFSGRTVTALPPGNTVRATVDLVDSKGVALAHREILLHPKNQGTQVDGKTIVDGDSVKHTNIFGHVEFMLVRGQDFTVAIAGTNIVRDFTTPTDPAIETFDMLDPGISSDDLFTVQKPNLNYAVRRSL